MYIAKSHTLQHTATHCNTLQQTKYTSRKTCMLQRSMRDFRSCGLGSSFNTNEKRTNTIIKFQENVGKIHTKKSRFLLVRFTSILCQKHNNQGKKHKKRWENMKHAEKTRNMPGKHETCRKNMKHAKKTWNMPKNMKYAEKTRNMLSKQETYRKKKKHNEKT